jgi:hypothetical protein
MYIRHYCLEQDYFILKSHNKVDGWYASEYFQIMESTKHIIPKITNHHLLVHLEGKEPGHILRWYPQYPENGFSFDFRFTGVYSQN